MADVEAPLASDPAAQTEQNWAEPSESHDGTTSTSLAATTESATSDTLITTNAEGKRVKKIVKKKRRPARPQVDPATFKTEPPPQTGTIFNIWYNKWSGGDREDSYLSKTAAKSRCSIARDSGYTRADSVPGSFACLFFARGLCPKGKDCEYLHRLPGTFDIYSGNVDVFGRDKHSDYRDDMGGVGSFMRQNRTLYVGRVHPSADVEEVVARHFAEWGNVERIRVLPQRGVAFVTYATEALAQFAKEAMAHQALDNGEILNVRWATVDPNPASAKREAKLIEQQAAEAVRRALPKDFVAEIEGDESAKRRRIDAGGMGLDGYNASDDVWLRSQQGRLRGVEGGVGAGGGVYASALEGPAQRRMIEQAGNGSAETERGEGSGSAGGLFGASTLAALEQYNPDAGGSQAKADEASKGPLVAYDDDSD